ncbi:STY4526/YPO1902 family pathogenicity island replication protein, partial [Pseudomonas aeruginosa]|uniref:STY4526/YPO1902 family pathogenicity island replication protein n=1 Tax=Pseudomonas aeruginosa TaxID=287 RepID=UPI003967E49B
MNRHTSLPVVDITIRHDVLQKLLASSHDGNRRQGQLNRADRLGCSSALLCRYFGLDSTATSPRR